MNWFSPVGLRVEQYQVCVSRRGVVGIVSVIATAPKKKSNKVETPAATAESTPSTAPVEIKPQASEAPAEVPVAKTGTDA